MKKNSQSGFTLIELLVVIAIIGILASVVLASLNSARNKGADAATKAQLANARAQAEIYYDGNSSSYASVCTGTNGIGSMATAIGTTSGTAATCNSNASNWYMFGKLKTGTLNTSDGYCVDSTGVAKATNYNNSANNTNFVCI